MDVMGICDHARLHKLSEYELFGASTSDSFFFFHVRKDVMASFAPLRLGEQEIPP